MQDFRFLCPNGTAFDQEAQTCADFGDVDCEQATLYYGSDNFDLYRIGSGFDTPKRPPTPPSTEDDESTFHLQRAESSKFPDGSLFIVREKKILLFYMSWRNRRRSLFLQMNKKNQPKCIGGVFAIAYPILNGALSEYNTR